MNPQYACDDTTARREQIRRKKSNGIDYIEVSEDQLTLTLHFIGDAPPSDRLKIENIRIEGGVRVRDIRVTGIRFCRDDDPETDDCLRIRVDKYGDFSPYVLKLLKVDAHGQPLNEPLEGFDPRYSEISFSFKANCPSDQDCEKVQMCPPAVSIEPDISYLAKDYESFRQLLLDRMSLIMPDWKERHIPDMGIALLEILAYTGDRLSYFQDAVGTEAYLDTARLRVSVRRHARLVDYFVHDGCNARAWVVLCLQGASSQKLPAGSFYFLSGLNNAIGLPAGLVADEDLESVSRASYEVFEPLLPAGLKEIELRQAHNDILFYTWHDRECCLEAGATAATLIDDWKETPSEKHPGERLLKLNPDDVLIFEEVFGPATLAPGDADPRHRWAVRLTKVEAIVDQLFDRPLLNIEWRAEDALPFPLCLSSIGPAPACEYTEGISVAHANVLLVDHGRTLNPADLGSVPVCETRQGCADDCSADDPISVPGRFRPILTDGPLTFAEPVLDWHAPASGGLSQDPRKALPQVKWMRQTLNHVQYDWTPLRDLLSSPPDERNYVVETESDGTTQVRFGDGTNGRMPEAGSTFQARWRIGNGAGGNVGAEAISYIVLKNLTLSGAILSVRNPFAAMGGVDPEALANVRAMAPQMFRARQLRAIVAEDYARLAELHPRVQRAVASLRWSPGWFDVLVGIDPIHAVEADQQLLDEVRKYLLRYRRIGHDLTVAGAIYVPLSIRLEVCVRANFLRAHVKDELTQVFSNRVLPDGRLGFFHPDNLTFGTAITISKQLAAAQAVAGVERASITRLRRMFDFESGELAAGVLKLGPLEIARVDSDPTFPENGAIEIVVRGGR